MPILADTTYQQYVTPLHQLDGMTLLIGAFFLWCLANPGRVKNRSQYWSTFVCLVAITVCYGLRLMLYNSPAGQVFIGVCVCALQTAGLVLTVMYAGGLSAAQIGGELRDAASDFRAGGEASKPTIVPLTGERPKAKEPSITHAPKVNALPPAEAPRVVIDLPKRPPDGPLPLE